MENKIVIVILGMTVLFGLIAIGYLIYSIYKVAILEKKHTPAEKIPMPPPASALENKEFSDESYLDEATVFLYCNRTIKLQFTKIADKPSERIEFLCKESIVIGRSSDADISIEDIAISRYHLRLSFLNGELQIQDLGTTNGTFLNGTKLIPMQLVPVSPKSTVNIGKTSFIITYMN